MKLFKIFWIAAKRLYLENFSYQASALAFVTLLAIVPLISVFLYIISFLPIFADFINLTDSYIFANFIPTSSDVIQQYLNQFADQATHLPMFSLVFSIVTSFLLMLTIETVMDSVWLLPHRKKSMWMTIISCSLLIFLPIFIGLSAFITGYIESIPWIKHNELFFLFAFNLIINSLIFATFYLVIPNKVITWREGIMGGLITALLFECAKKIFIIYLKYFSTYEIIYGTLAIIPIFLVWLYVVWYIIIFGALLIESKQAFENASSPRVIPNTPK